MLDGPLAPHVGELLQYMYRGKAIFTGMDNALLLLALADLYSVKELRQSASDYIVSGITRDNALSVLNEAINLRNAEEVLSIVVIMF